MQLVKEFNFVSYQNYKRLLTIIFTIKKGHAKKFGELQISAIKGKIELFTSFIQTSYLNSMSSTLWCCGLSTCCACKILVHCSNFPKIARTLRSFKFSRM